MPNDIDEALRALMDAARGRAFFWDNPARPGQGWRAISRIDIDTSMNEAGATRFYVTVGATDYANQMLTGMADKLVDAVIAAHSALAALPLATDVPLYGAVTLPAPAPVNDTGAPPAAEVA
ncbi:hypothetical protein ACIU1J_27505 [Azospirillum doebereinerae]|uniref:hypothetical protein n=1 Tax=Azospirillum doebereinerae TaxID=92933 RepID=UPI001EE53BDC|nr:hypothetical protein [Azospirillum doebereinerae]MCG5241366.1 hypothetical protein [Azospirillum doebereinerae]